MNLFVSCQSFCHFFQDWKSEVSESHWMLCFVLLSLHPKPPNCPFSVPVPLPSTVDFHIHLIALQKQVECAGSERNCMFYLSLKGHHNHPLHMKCYKITEHLYYCEYVYTCVWYRCWLGGNGLKKSLFFKTILVLFS